MTLLTQQELHSIQVEQRILEVIMTRDEAYDKYSDFIRLDLFFAERHKIIYRAIVSLKKTDPKQELDLVLVGDRLKQVNKLKEAGGDEYLSQIFNSPHVMLSYNLDEHIKTLEDLRLRREMSDKLNIAVHSLSDRENNALDVLHNCVDSMVNVSTGHVESKTQNMTSLLHGVIDQVEYIKKHGVTFMRTGYDDLDKSVMADVGNQWVIAGRPTMGKTILAENITRFITKTTGKAGVIFSLEMKASDMAIRMLSAEGSIPVQALKKEKISEDNYARFYATTATIRELNIHVNDDRSITLAGIKTELARIYRNHGEIGVVMVDYIQIMKEVIEAGGELRTKIAEISRALRAVAQQYNCLMILLSQVNRQCESRPDKRPHMGDLKDSSALEQDADIITMVYRHDKYEKDVSKHTNVVEVIVAKNRSGSDGTVRLAFEGQYSRFSNLTTYNTGDEIPPYGSNHL